MRINLVVTPGDLTEGVFGAARPRWVLIARAAHAPPPSWYAEGVAAVCVAADRLWPEHKTTAYLSGWPGLALARRVPEGHHLMRAGDWKLIHYWEDGRNELYNLGADIGETNDLARAESKRTAELWAQLQAWLKATGARIPQPNPEYQPAWAEQRQKAAQLLKERLEKQHAQFLNPGWQPDPTWWKSLTTSD